jgi:hypothetical protein
MRQLFFHLLTFLFFFKASTNALFIFFTYLFIFFLKLAPMRYLFSVKQNIFVEALPQNRCCPF